MAGHSVPGVGETTPHFPDVGEEFFELLRRSSHKARHFRWRGPNPTREVVNVHLNALFNAEDRVFIDRLVKGRLANESVGADDQSSHQLVEQVLAEGHGDSSALQVGSSDSVPTSGQGLKVPA